MSRPLRRIMPLCRARAGAIVAMALIGLAASGCDGLRRPGAKPPFDTGRLESAIDASFGGVGTCLLVLDAKSGARLYRYGSHGVCENPLPPCETFAIPSLLIALDAKLVTPQTVLKWPGGPEPVSAWRRDFDTAEAFKQGVDWWDRRMAVLIGQGRMHERLKALDFGNAKTDGPADGFWLGPATGGQLAITTAKQADFVSRLARGRLPVDPASAAYVQGLMQDETRGETSLADKVGSCASQPDRSRHVTWWVGRLHGPQQDYAFAASLEGSSEDALPGSELAERGKRAFAEAGMWPAGT